MTIFFSDIVGFTNISSTMAPHLVMSMLDRLYTQFDALSERYKVLVSLCLYYCLYYNLYTKFDALSERLIFVLTKLVISLTN